MTSGHRICGRKRAAALVAALIGLIAGAPAWAADVAEFYRDRTVSVIIGYSVGGGYDTYARLLAKHMGKYIPGNPTLVPQNLPGAGSLKAANYLYAVAPRDGSVFGTVARGMAMEPLLGGAQFDARNFTWLGSVTNEVSFCAAWHDSPIKTLDDARNQEFVVGGNGSGSDPDIYALALKNVFGLKIKLVTGYPGSSDIDLALERGEIAGRCGWSWDSLKSRHAAWLGEKKINLLVVFAAAKDPEMPADVPLILDLAKTDEQRQILKLIFARQILGRPFFGPPGIPWDRKEALRAAFDATMQDPDFIAEAKRINLEVNPVPGAEIDTLMAELYATPKDVIAKTTAAIQK
jgi:tripartite-type tricarboxylate transporter receptor subunit TctC